MHELDHLFPAAVEIVIGGRAVSVRPLVVREFAAMMRAMGPVQDAFRIDTLEVDFDAILCDAAAAEMIAVGLRREMDFVFSLTADERRIALAHVISSNYRFFFPENAEAEAEDDEKRNVFRIPDHGAVLTDTFQRLIASGHGWADILDYTLDEVMAFSASVARVAAEERRDELVVARAAVATPDVFRAVFGDVTKRIG